MKYAVQIVAGIWMLGISSTTFSSSLVFKNQGVAVFAVAGNAVVWVAKPPIHENSSLPVGSQGLAIKRSGELRVWTNQDNVYIPGTVVALPNPVPSQSLAFVNNSDLKTKATIYPAPQSGAPALGAGNGGDDPTNLSSQDIYLENHVSESDPVNHTSKEYCNYGDGRIEFDPTNGNRLLFNHKDHLGSTRAVEAEDGSAVERVVYDAYGAVAENEMSGVEKPGKDKFTGKELDNEGGSPAGAGIIRLNLRVSAIADELTDKSVYVTLNDGTMYEFGLERNAADNSYYLQNDIEINGGSTLKAIQISILYNNPNRTEYSVGVDAGCGFNITILGGKTQQVNFDQPFTNTAVFTLGSHHKDCNNSAAYFVLPSQTTNTVAAGMKLYYFGKRYYDAEIALWTACDIKHQFWSPYIYSNPINGIDPNGLDWLRFNGKQVLWYGGDYGNTQDLKYTYSGVSGHFGYQEPTTANFKEEWKGPVAPGKFYIDLEPDIQEAPIRAVESGFALTSKGSTGGIETIPAIFRTLWGNFRALLHRESGESYGRDGQYFHDSNKGETSGCIECDSKLFNDLIDYKTEGNDRIEVQVEYDKKK
jgi:RHS repeat-associated protein